MKVIEKYKKKGIVFQLIYICQSQQDLIGKYNYDYMPKSFYKKKYEEFPINLHKIKIPKALVVGDFWLLNKYQWEYIFKKYDISYAISIVLNHYAPPTINSKFLSSYVKKISSFLTTLEQFLKYQIIEIEKKYDFVSLGAKEIKFYPNRQYFENVLKKNYSNENSKIVTADHPGYKYNNKDKTKYFGKRYLKLLSESHFMITDTTDLDIPLIKHLECMYYGCTMVCDNIYFEKKINFEMDTIILKLIENRLIKKLNI